MYFCIVSIIRNIGNLLLQQKLKRRSRKKVMCDLDGAKTVGILFTADSIDSYNQIVQLANNYSDVRGKKILCIGFVENPKQFELFAEQSGFRFFSAKHCNWYGRPKDHSVDFFIEKDFDVLLDLTLKDNITMNYIVGMSKAKYKVGSLKPQTKLYDMMIDVAKNNTLDNLINQIELYLSMFKVENNKEA